MLNSMLKSALVLTSACALGAPWSKPEPAKKVTSPQWRGETTLATAIASATYRGSGFAGQNYTSSAQAITPGDGNFSTVGLQLKESMSWKEWVSLELSGAYSHSLGASASEWTFDAIPASLSLWDASSSLFSSIPLDRMRSVCIEPAVGFALVAANLKAAYNDMPQKNWEQLLFYGPTAGLYMRLALSPKVNLRVGGGYMASRLRIKKYYSGQDYTIFDPGTYAGKYDYRSRRGGLSALVELKYLWKSWVQLHTSVDYQSWSAGGKPANYGGPISSYAVPSNTTTPMLSRLRFSWGANFTY